MLVACQALLFSPGQEPPGWVVANFMISVISIWIYRLILPDKKDMYYNANDRNPLGGWLPI